MRTKQKTDCRNSCEVACGMLNGSLFGLSLLVSGDLFVFDGPLSPGSFRPVSRVGGVSRRRHDCHHRRGIKLRVGP